MTKPGDKVKVVTSDQEIEGILMPEEDEFVVLKMDTGYNIGIDKKRVREVALLEHPPKREVEFPKAEPKKGLPTISILHTGGPIASKVDYSTGGVVAQFEPSKILEMFPELRDVANIESCQVNTVWGKPFNETESPLLLMQDLGITDMFSALGWARMPGPHIELLSKTAGIRVESIDDWYAVINWWFEKYGNYAVAVKSVNAYYRNIDYQQVEYAEASPVFDNILHKLKLTAEELKTLLDDIFGDLPVREIKETQKHPLKNIGATYLYEQDIPQTIIRISQAGISRKDEDYYNAKIMNFILGESGFGSRLMEEAREKRGLTYGIYSYFQEFDESEILKISTSNSTDIIFILYFFFKLYMSLSFIFLFL